MAQYPNGIDVSSAQGGSLNWANIKSSGISFAWAKATEGGTNYYEDSPDFQNDESGAVAAGVLIGAYHYARYDLDTGTNGAAAEAQWFWYVASPYIKTNGQYLMPMLDVESAETNQQNYLKTYTQAAMSQWVNAWCTTVSNLAAAQNITVTPVIYSSSSFANTWFNSSVSQWIPWIADWTGSTVPSVPSNPPAGTSPWSTWVVWQYDDVNDTFSGAPTSCDVDVFNGTMAQLTNTLVIGRASTNSVPAPPAGVTNYWDPGLIVTLPGSGGSGTWDGATTSNWFHNGTGDVQWSTAGDYAIFAGTSGTVTLGTSVEANSLTFSNGGYNIAGSSTLTMISPGNIVVPTGTTNTISCVLGGVAFNLSGGGVLNLNNTGNYSSGENVVGPNTTLQIPTDHPAGNDGVTLNLSHGGIYQDLDATSGDQFLLPGSAVALGMGGGIFENPNGNLSMTNYITGAGSLTLIGTTFTLTLSDAANNYTGGTIVQSGTLKASVAGAMGSTSGAITVNGGTLNLGGASHMVGAVTITNGTISTGTLTGSSYTGQNGTISANLAGTAGFNKTTTGTVTLSGTNTYSGITTITSGLLQISSDTNLGAAPGSPVTNSITINSGATTNNYGLRISANVTLNPNRGITLGATGGQIQVAQNDTLTYGGIITGSGSFEDGTGITVGYGTLILSGANTYKGATTIAAGTLRLGANGSLPSGTPLTIASANIGGTFDLNTHSQTIGPLSSSTGINGTGTTTPGILLTGPLTINETNGSTFAGTISGSGGSLTVTGNSVLTLTGTNTYTGNTAVSAGTLALGATGSINNTPSISIAAGAKLDVSAIAAYTLSASTTLTASGTASPATINGGTTVSLGSQPIILNYDGADAALVIAQGTLVLNGNAFMVNGSPLGIGNYTLIQQTSGNISGAGTFSVSGTAIGGMIGSISISNGSVNLNIAPATPTPVFSNLSSNQSIIYGATGITLSGTVSATGPIYPAFGETVTATINSNAQNTTIIDSNGDFSFTYNITNLPATGTPYTIAYYYGGDGSLTAAANTNTALTVGQRPVTLIGSRPYDGTTTAAAAILSVANVVGSDVVTVASGSGTLASSNAGPETITSIGTLLLGGPAAGNYTLAGASGAVTITVPPFSITGGSVDVSGSNFVITWQSAPGAVYQVVGTTNLTSARNSWTNAGPPITATNATTSATNPIIGVESFFDVIGQ